MEKDVFDTPIVTQPTQGIVPRQLDKIIEKGLSEVEQILAENSEHEQELIKQTLSHALLGGGKRLRSRFILTSWLLFNQNLSQDVIDVAAAAEIFHTATLLHDDVLDDAYLRRGNVTVNIRWGNRHAVLLGDFLLSRSFRLLNRVGSLRIMETFVEAAQDLGQGALIEQIHRDNINISEELYFHIITCKTAAFFRACAQAGAVLSNASETYINLLREFGLNYGIAFQITDDLLDVISDESTMGKPKGKDILEGHLTLPWIKYFEKDKNNLPKVKLSELKQNDDEFLRLMEGIRRDGAISYSYSRAEEYQQKAICALDKLPQNDANDFFRQITLDLIKRKS